MKQWSSFAYVSSHIYLWRGFQLPRPRGALSCLRQSPCQIWRWWLTEKSLARGTHTHTHTHTHARTYTTRTHTHTTRTHTHTTRTHTHTHTRTHAHSGWLSSLKFALQTKRRWCWNPEVEIAATLVHSVAAAVIISPSLSLMQLLFERLFKVAANFNVNDPSLSVCLCSSQAIPLKLLKS